MNKLLLQTLDNNTKRFNHTCISGIAKPVFEDIPAYLEKIFRESINRINPEINFKFLEIRRITPEEELLEDNYTKARGKDPDLAKNDVYLTLFKFEYNKEIINKYIYLPFANRGNIMTISGTPYVVTPVITDLVISINSNFLFVRLYQDKFNIYNEPKNIAVNVHVTPDKLIKERMIYVSMLSNNKDIMKKNCKTPYALYLLAKYGIKETLKKYADIEYGKDFWLVYDKNNEIDLDLNEYTVYSTTFNDHGLKPKGYDQSNVYLKQNVKVVVANKYVNDIFILNIVLAIIYCLDLTPGPIEKEIADIINTNNLNKEIYCWRYLLAKTILKSRLSTEKIMTDVNQHMNELDTYLDTVSKEKLSSLVKLENYYDFITYIIKTYSESISNSRQYNSDVNNIYIDLYYYICYDIIIGFNRAIKSINNRFKKGGTPPKYKEILKILNLELKEKLIFDLIKSTKCSLALSGVDYSGDNLYIKLTSNLENQNRGDGVRKGGDEKFPMSIRTIKGSDVAYGSPLFLTKTTPTGKLRLGLWANFELKTGAIIISDDIKPTIDSLDNTLKGVKDISELQLENMGDELGKDDDFESYIETIDDTI